MDRAELERRYKRMEVLASRGGGHVHLTEEDCNVMAEAMRVSLSFPEFLEDRAAPPSGAVPLFHGRVGAPFNEAHIAPPPPPPAPSVPLVKGNEWTGSPPPRSQYRDDGLGFLLALLIIVGGTAAVFVMIVWLSL